jgi:putative ABC transport system permease protein
MKIVEGRDFTTSDNGKSRIICNQTFLKEYEFSKITGTKMDDSDFEIVGVIDDIHFASLHSAIKPLFFVTQSLAYHAKYGNYFFIKIQHDYMRNYSWGFERENVLYIPVKTSDINVATFENELKQNPNILDCTISAALPGNINQNWGMEIGGKEVYFASWIVRSDFLDFFGMKVIDGRNFTTSDDGKSRLICNQAFLKEYEFSKITGTKMDDSDFEIVGVIDDIHFESLHSNIKPLFFVTQSLAYHAKYGIYFFIKVDGNNTLQTVESIEKIWKKLSDEPINLNFLDANMDKLYEKESNLAKLISIFGVIAVIIAVMGVYGLIVFNAKYKQKEIAIRKVNGSTIKEIMLMLNRNVLIQLGIAFVIAVPVAYFIVQKWLESFAYKTPVYWWVFLLGGMIILLITVITVSAQSYKAAKRNPTRALNSD